MKKWTRVSSIAAAAGMLSTAAWADVIALKNGQTYSGSISRQGDVMVIRTDDGKVITAKPEEIAGVTLVNSLTPAEASKAEWSRTTLQVKAALDLETIIGLHEAFLARYPEAAEAPGVRNSLQVYQELAKNHGVKFRGRWLAATQVDVVVKQWAEAARPAVDWYKTGNMRGVLDAVKPVIAADNENPDALTVAGLASYRLGQLTPAKGYFTNLASADPTSLLAENNLAVISHQQKAMGEEIAHYVKALQIDPDNRLLLDNIAEAINAYTGDKNHPVFKSLVKQFEPADKRMREVMAAKDKGSLYRWGSGWVNKEDLDKLQKNKADVQSQMADAGARYKNIQESLSVIDAQIRQANIDYDNAAQVLTYYNNLLAVPTYYDVSIYIAQRDAALRTLDQSARNRTYLQGQRDQILAGSKDFFGMVDRVKANLAAATSEYTGVERIMDLGEDRTPPVPLAVAVPGPLPAPPPMNNIVINPAPPPPPIMIPIGIGVVVPTGPGNGGHGNGDGDGDGGRGRGGRGRGGRGGPGTQPSTGGTGTTQPGG